MKKNNTIFCVFLYLLSFFILWESRNFPEQSAFFPQLLAYLLIFLNTILLFQIWTGRLEEKKDEEETVKSKFYYSAGLSILYVLLIDVLGYVLVTPLYLFTLMFLLKKKARKIRTLVIISLSVTGIIYITFNNLLNVPLPPGLLFSL